MALPVSEDGPAGPPAAPQRVLIVSAAIGAGHDATGRALQDAARRLWPECEVRWLDVLDAMGPGMGALARTFYVVQIQRLPWLYEQFFQAIWRHRSYLTSTRHVIGAWSGRRMARSIRDYAPNLIISTYPLGSAGLGWLRRNRGLSVPIGAWVSDFCPHPYWIYPDLDVTYVMHPAGLPVAQRAEPGARVAVGCLPVRDAFGPASRTAARARLGLDPGRFIVLLATGSLGFGSVDRAVSALLAAGPDVQVIAACGRNEAARRRLLALGLPEGRLQVLGWTAAMPDLINAADVVTTNGGGVTAAEAVCCRRPVIMFDPIAGHGRANAQLMASAGLAVLCPGPADLTAAVSRLARDPAAMAGLAGVVMHDSPRSGEDDLQDLVAGTVLRTAPAAGSAGAPAPAT
jgi:UDP-N-acetylglucosamine:LPS N-acetylglucosamine transferase